MSANQRNLLAVFAHTLDGLERIGHDGGTLYERIGEFLDFLVTLLDMTTDRRISCQDVRISFGERFESLLQSPEIGILRLLESFSNR